MSQRAMNNVVIFAMLIMIALFNIDSFLPAEKAGTPQPLMPEGAYVLKVEQDQQRLERAGQQWRYITDKPLSSDTQALAQRQLEAWQRGQLVPYPAAESSTRQMTPMIVVVWVAGNAQGLVYAFYPTPAETLVSHNGQWYRLTEVSLSGLIPWYGNNAE
ncbi:hypothetical protein OCL06_09360 [Alteromonas sp. ASW11-19]|uniref:DUF4019 domain-containing protein n=1 Tax=Alteromonas salexigens TaxID=2982530 RepID=A0ABT2VNC3_9ALTE|nr:hypothetical protein [Alteromonas salexigens]MCU7554806.1 hypothetical protein [Alteromonas salexigens]